MKEANFFNLACRHCRHYQPEGRRGGACQQLGVSVGSNWKACALASSPFDDTFDKLDTTLTKLEEIVHLETAFSLPYKPYTKTFSQLKNSSQPEASITKKAPI